MSPPVLSTSIAYKSQSHFIGIYAITYIFYCSSALPLLPSDFSLLISHPIPSYVADTCHDEQTGCDTLRLLS
jgi:hypothetical protein